MYLNYVCQHKGYISATDGYGGFDHIWVVLVESIVLLEDYSVSCSVILPFSFSPFFSFFLKLNRVMECSIVPSSCQAEH